MTSVPARPFFSRLGFQIAFLLAVVLLPLTAVSMMSSAKAISETQARGEAALTGATLFTIGSQLHMIQEAHGLIVGLAKVIAPSVGNDAACTAIMKSIAADLPQYAHISFVPKDGQLRCSSTGKSYDVANNPIFQRLTRSQQPGFAVNPKSPITGTSVLALTQPVYSADGQYIGYVVAALEHSKLDISNLPSATNGPLEVMTFDRNGQVLLATGGIASVAPSLPKDRPLIGLKFDRPQAFTAMSAGGVQKVYSVVPVVPGELYAMGTWPLAAATGQSAFFFSLPFLLPVVIWIASLVAAWMSVETLVNRPIRRLNQSIKSFAGGHRETTTINMKGAPLELREMAAAYERMTDAVMRDEAELENTVHQKEVLLREVHHRVKNNLQMIVSILNLHARKAATPEAREVLMGVQTRVMSLAAIHREVYQTPGKGEVDAAPLLDAIARQVVQFSSSPDQRIDLRFALDELWLTVDQAVTLALLLGEAVMLATRFAGTSATVPIEVRLSRSASETAILTVTGTFLGLDLHPPGPNDGANALIMQLMAAFAAQLGAEFETKAAGSSFWMTAKFHLQPLIEAELRHAPEAAP